MPRGRAGLSLALLLVAAGAAAIPAAGQEIAGLALDSAGRPLARVPVALHRIGGGGGATVAATTTDAEGRFRFALDTADSAVYFVAMRHEGRLFIGPPARGGADAITDYVVRADPASEAGAVASALSGSGAPPPGAASPSGQGIGASAGPQGGAGAVWFVVLLAVAVAVVFLTTAPAYRERRKREMLLELASIETRMAAGPEQGDPADRRRRDALRGRLAPPG